MSGIYIHIPFCKQACSYCDFYFLTRQQLRQPYVDALVKEIEERKESAEVLESVRTIYLGGGTPSLLTRNQLEKIFDALNRVYNVEAEEVTMELNPDDVTVEYLQILLELGVNRASMGIQSFQPEILTFMHRAHTREEALNALDALQKAGFPSFTADLIYGNPGQTPEMVEHDIDRLLEFDPPHISAYSLTIEPDTRLGKQVKMGRVTPPDDETVAAHFDLVANKLYKAGIEQYEVSNFAVPGKEAIHNSSYWRHENYIGFGPSAHSFLRTESGGIRWHNKPDLKAYLEMDFGSIMEEKEELDLNTLGEERIMLGLRTKWGVDLKNLASTYQYRLSPEQLIWIEDQVDSGNVILSNETLKMTKQGLKISDLLVVGLLSKA